MNGCFLISLSCTFQKYVCSSSEVYYIHQLNFHVSLIIQSVVPQDFHNFLKEKILISLTWAWSFELDPMPDPLLLFLYTFGGKYF